MSAALCLASYAVGVSVTAPLLLRRSTSNSRTPRLAAAAWLAAAASVIASWFAAAVLTAVAAPPAVAALAVGAAALLLARLTWVGVATVRRDQARRTRHRDGLRLVARPDYGLGVWVLDAAQPLAYAVPGRGGLIVVTRGAYAMLSSSQLSAVLAHERTHLAERHDLMTLFACVVRRALSWLPLFAQLAAHVALLMEMRADDAAAREHGADAVAGALSILSGHTAPAGAFAAAGASVALRTRRLHQTAQPCGRFSPAVAVAASAAAAFAAGPLLAGLDVLCLHML